MSGHGSEKVQAIAHFEELWDNFELPDFLWYNIERCNYTKPTPIQRYSIPAALSGQDCMCCAQTGSGKTCAFLLPILSSLDEATATGLVGIEVGAPAAPKALVLAPTRELCSQIHLEARKLSFDSKIRASEVYGGVEAKPQLRELALGSDIVTATPGRLTDFINRGVVTMSEVYYLVLDEADRMLDMGFEPQIREIVQRTDMPSASDGRMTLMFSATFPKEIQRLAQAFMRQYIWIGVGQVGGAVDTVEQNFVTVHPREKQRQAIQLLKDNPNDTTLIFVAMKRTAASLVDDLAYKGFNAVAIHGDMEQPEREASLSRFRSGKATFMVATDVCARGLDIPKVTHVINYDLPENIEDYVHRIGRTGRIGRNGYATSLYVTEGNWNNHKILKSLMELFQKSGRDLPDVLQEQADIQGIRLGGKGGGRNKYGGNDHRGGPSRNFKVSNKGGGYQGPSKGKGKGKGGGDRNSGGRNFGGDRDYDRSDRDYDRGNNSKPDNRYGGNNGYNNNGNNGYSNGNSNGFQGSRREAPSFQSNGSGRGFGGQRSDGPPDRSSWGQQMR
jgi:ATP-dependent RNA helicase DDX3X